MQAHAVIAVLMLASAVACSRPEAGPAERPAPSGPILGVGVVTAINQPRGEVTLDHEPIAAIGWTAMTMTFKVKEKSMLDGMSVGDAVEFELENAEGYREISRLTRR